MKDLTNCAKDVLKVIEAHKGEPVGVEFIRNSTTYSLDFVNQAICELNAAGKIEQAEGYTFFYKAKNIKNEPEKV